MVGNMLARLLILDLVVDIGLDLPLDLAVSLLELEALLKLLGRYLLLATLELMRLELVVSSLCHRWHDMLVVDKVSLI